MNSERLCCVVTTIQQPTSAVRAFAERFTNTGIRFVVVGDKKGPADFALPGVDFFSITAQDNLPFKLAALLPKNHYTRKNLGYLIAISEGCTVLYETDDDNAPASSWKPRTLSVEAAQAASAEWVNVYGLFSSTRIWPRGFPLEQITAQATLAAPTPNATLIDAPIQQGLADGSPDVDAVWRMTLDKPVEFEQRPSVRLSRNSWCPFNSQSTWWWPVAFPLLYLPSNCTFRMTDIWRSFIAQRCIWELDTGIVFHASEVFQERNQHNLLNDFRDEVPGYLGNAQIAKTLESLSLQAGSEYVAENMTKCYEALIEKGFFPPAERALVDAWITDIASVVK